jgi:hypothetical protein
MIVVTIRTMGSKIRERGSKSVKWTSLGDIVRCIVLDTVWAQVGFATDDRHNRG